MAVTSGLDATGRSVGVRGRMVGRRDLNGMWQTVPPMVAPWLLVWDLTLYGI